MDRKFALVTGTSSGLGKAMAESLLDEGHVVFGLSRSGSSIMHGCYVDILADVRDESSVEEAYKVIEETTDSLHVIVNSAGILVSDPLAETSLNDFRSQLDTNVLGPFLVLKHGANFLVEKETHIITISSLAAKKPFPDLGAYSASKCALDGMIRTLEKEWQHFDLRFSTFHPGPVDTPLWDSMEVDGHRESMLSVEDFIQVFEQVIKAPCHMHSDDITFFRREGLS